MSLKQLRRHLLADLRARGSVLVAFSGGIDSALVAALAFEAVEDRALAVTALTETLAARELENARCVARDIGIRHETIHYSELDDSEFVANPLHRCYVCQGLRAIREHGVYSPLLVHEVDKRTARQLAREMGLAVWNRPSNACLSSRLRHGEVITLGKLRKVEIAEDLLHEAGFRVVRVRHEQGSARVEVGADEVAKLEEMWGDVAPRLQALGLDRVILDACGYREGGADSAPKLPASS